MAVRCPATYAIKVCDLASERNPSLFRQLKLVTLRYTGPLLLYLGALTHSSYRVIQPGGFRLDRDALDFGVLHREGGYHLPPQHLRPHHRSGKAWRVSFS